MRRALALVSLLLLLAVCSDSSHASLTAVPSQQLPTAPEVASYTIDAQLDPSSKTVNGQAQIRYTNPSEDTLQELYLRLYLKAFSSLDTLWMLESGGESRGFSIHPDELGDITIQRLTLADGTDLLASSTLTDTLLQVPLTSPLEPGQTITLETTWVSKLPRAFARTGYGGRNDTFFMVGQWYPKMAVYDRGAWDTEPWHANAEFFNDFGNYDVTIRAPASYVIAGAGVPNGSPQTAGDLKTWTFRSTSVTDYAFAASPHFRTEQVQSSNGVEIVLYYLPEHQTSVPEYLRAAKGSVETFSQWFGQYPHARLSVVDVPDDAEGAGGMEYPTLVTGGTVGMPAESGMVAYVTAHEIGHQWWPMQTATNEAREPWLDEGLTEYSGARYMTEIGQNIGTYGFGISAEQYERINSSMASDQALDLPSWEYDSSDYGAIVYGKTATGLWTMEQLVGTERFRKAMAAYLSEWRFRHPTSADFQTVIERELGPQPWFFEQYAQGETIDYGIQSGSTPESVQVTREGDVVVPVDVQATFLDGTTQSQVWDGTASSTELTFRGNSELLRVELDPSRKLVAEIDRADNGLSLQPEWKSFLVVVARLMFIIQSFLQSFGLFG